MLQTAFYSSKGLKSPFQIGGAQTNVGYNQNAVNVAQTNNQNVGGQGGNNKGYDAPKYRPAPQPEAENPYRH